MCFHIFRCLLMSFRYIFLLFCSSTINCSLLVSPPTSCFSPLLIYPPFLLSFLTSPPSHHLTCSSWTPSIHHLSVLYFLLLSLSLNFWCSLKSSSSLISPSPLHPLPSFHPLFLITGALPPVTVWVLQLPLGPRQPGPLPQPAVCERRERAGRPARHTQLRVHQLPRWGIMNAAELICMCISNVDVRTKHLNICKIAWTWRMFIHFRFPAETQEWQGKLKGPDRKSQGVEITTANSKSVVVYHSLMLTLLHILIHLN